jgi:cytoskeleton protein RodZ
MGDAQNSATGQPPPPRSIGERLRAGRERAGLSVAAAAEKLHLDPKVIEALEADRFADLGASVYVRGHLRRYADFVGEQGRELVDAYAAREAPPPPPDLTQIPQAEHRADPRRLVSPLIGVGSGLVLLFAIWWVLAGSGPDAGSPPSAAQVVPAPAPAVSDTPVAANEAASIPESSVAEQPAAQPVAAVPQPAPVAEQRETPPPARPARLTLQLTNDSWVEVYDSRGERLFYDVASAGSVQSVEGLPPLRVTLGNAVGVAVEVNGRSREIPASAIDGEGARFVVNRSGSLSRARQ